MKLFEPGTMPLKRLYPELRDEPDFRSLSDNEMLFVWYYACKDSPINGVKKSDRVVKTFEYIPEFAQSLSEDIYNNYIDRAFPAYISQAIKRMEAYEPAVRNKAKVYTDRIFNYINEATSMPFPGGEDAGKLKAFMDMQLNIGKNIPLIIQAAEQGYGYVRAIKDEKKKSGTILEDE